MQGFSEYVLKISGRCNLNCSYCYMFNLADQSWQNQPKSMSYAVLKQFAIKSVTHALSTGRKSISIGLHGGEPLLLGKDKMRLYIDTLKSIYHDKGISPKFGLQTNGVLIDEEWADLLFEREVTVGLSVDGPERFHDQYRVNHEGKGSYKEVLRGLKILKQKDFGGFFPGVISVINADIDPIDYYTFIKEIEVDWFDVRMPLHHYGDPPPIKKYAYHEWYTALFDLWFNDSTKVIQMRFFNEIIDLALGSKFAGSEMTGLAASGLLIIESDGTIEPSDNLKACGEGFTKTNLNVATHEIGDAARVKIIQMARKAEAELPSKCQQCKYQKVCGGGLLTNRFSPLTGFNNPTIYCNDMQVIVQHIVNTVDKDLIKHDIQKRTIFG